MRFKGKKPITSLHRKINGERRCICGAYLTLEEGDWTHPEIDEENEVISKQDKIDYPWTVKVAIISDMCPFKRLKFGEENICFHSKNTSGICSEENCKKKIG
ncbi:hypothetical protein KAU33_15760 [Candidatus Dependentiae bacterium]|nr:hypothetical protein [Candidatus Dependentiae bacterium]